MFKQDLFDDKLVKTNADNSYHIKLQVKSDETAKL